MGFFCWSGTSSQVCVSTAGERDELLRQNKSLWLIDKWTQHLREKDVVWNKENGTKGFITGIYSKDLTLRTWWPGIHFRSLLSSIKLPKRLKTIDPCYCQSLKEYRPDTGSMTLTFPRCLFLPNKTKYYSWVGLRQHVMREGTVLIRQNPVFGIQLDVVHQARVKSYSPSLLSKAHFYQLPCFKVFSSTISNVPLGCKTQTLLFFKAMMECWKTH